MTEEETLSEIKKDEVSTSASSGTNEKQSYVYGAAGLLLGAVGYAIIEYELLEGISLGLVAFFIFYTVVLLFIFSFFFKPSAGQTTVSLTSQHPNGLTRLRSYLTFLPITHIIQGDGKESLRVNEVQKCLSEKLNENELSIRISIQKELVIEAILDEYIVPWYTKISSNVEFLKQSKEILRSVFHQLGEKIRQVDRNELAKEAIQTVHLHWKEYCDALAKGSSTDDTILKCFKFVHPFLQDTSEVSRKYEHMICQLLEELVIPDLQSTLLCQFLAGILVKSFFLYYADFICQPSWVNGNLITLLTSGSAFAELAGSSSQNSSAPPTPQPDRSPKAVSISGENCSALPTPTPSESSASGFTPPQKPLFEKNEQDTELRYFFGNDSQDLQCMENRKYEADANLKEASLKEKSGEISVGKLPKCSPSSSVSSALSGVLPTTALPLLPAGSYSLEDTQIFGLAKPIPFSPLKSSNEKLSPSIKSGKASKPLPPNKDLEQTVVDDSSQYLVITDSSSEDQIVQGNSSTSSSTDRQCNDSSIPKTPTPTHYYSFDEITKRKSSHHILDTGTLSVDGATDAQKHDSNSSSVHELKIAKGDHELGQKPSRSPVYEEPEDFATSIAKLRSLLEQRDSKKNLNSSGGEDQSLSDLSSCASPDLIEAYHDSPNSLQIQARQACKIKEESAIMNSNEDLTNENSDSNLRKSNDSKPVASTPELKCFFLNIAIPKVESCSDSGGQYDFYCIQYEGVYFDEKYDDYLPRVILRTTTVKRRFKEFLLLQSKLEEHSQWKPHLKGIKAPNRWLNLSFSKADTAATRKTMLERYLHQLCYHPVLGMSREVLQFMAYGDDGFSLDPLDVRDPKHLLSDRLDKLAKKFTGVINSLKDALPSFDATPPSPSSEIGTPADNKRDNCIPSFQFSERLSPEQLNVEESEESLLDPKWIETLAPTLSSRHGTCDNLSAEDEHDNPNGENESSNKIGPVSQDSMEESGSAYPLAAALTQLLCDVLWLPNCRPHNASVSTFMSISGKSLENYVQETIDVFLSEEAVLGYLEWLAKSLKADMDSIQDIQFETATEDDLKNCLRRRIPAWVRWMWGRSRLDLTIERITGFFQDPMINHDLVLSLSELLFSKIVKCEMAVDKE